MSDKKSPVRPVDEEAMRLSSKLFSEARYGSLGVLEPETGVPLVSRVAVAWSNDIGLFFAGSDLSVHSKCLLDNANCSIMLGEPGKGDGLAYPRITVIGQTARMDNTDDRRSTFRETFLQIHPKAELYIDFADFGFYPVELERALLNGGFGKAYHLDKRDLSNLLG